MEIGQQRLLPGMVKRLGQWHHGTFFFILFSSPVTFWLRLLDSFLGFEINPILLESLSLLIFCYLYRV